MVVLDMVHRLKDLLVALSIGPVTEECQHFADQLPCV